MTNLNDPTLDAISMMRYGRPFKKYTPGSDETGNEDSDINNSIEAKFGQEVNAHSDDTGTIPDFTHRFYAPKQRKRREESIGHSLETTPTGTPKYGFFETEEDLSKPEEESEGEQAQVPESNEDWGTSHMIYNLFHGTENEFSDIFRSKKYSEEDISKFYDMITTLGRAYNR